MSLEGRMRDLDFLIKLEISRNLCRYTYIVRLQLHNATFEVK